MRTGVCVDCGVDVVGGARGRIRKRCLACTEVLRLVKHEKKEDGDGVIGVSGGVV